MPDDKNRTTNPTFPNPLNQDVTQPTTPGVIDPSSDTPPPPIIISQEEAQQKQEVPPKMSSSSTIDIPPVVVATNETKKYSLISKIGGRKKLITILGILVLVGGVGSGVYLTKQSQDIRERANIQERCSVNSEDACILKNPGSLCGDTGQTCEFIEGSTPDVESRRECECRQTSTPTPDSTTQPSSSYNCQTIKAYKVTGDPASSSSTWTEVALNNNTALEAGNDIYFVVKATYPVPDGSEGDNSPKIDKAIFIINDIKQAEATAKTPVCGGSNTCSIEFYQKYTIPANHYDFDVTATLHLKDTNSWF